MQDFSKTAKIPGFRQGKVRAYARAQVRPKTCMETFESDVPKNAYRLNERQLGRCASTEHDLHDAFGSSSCCRPAVHTTTSCVGTTTTYCVGTLDSACYRSLKVNPICSPDARVHACAIT
eukprot:6053975-Pleurochrysis_carterae.AAC.6